MAKLKKWYQFTEYDNPDTDDDETMMELRDTDDYSVFSLSMQISQDKFCCGLFSIGAFEIGDEKRNVTKKEKVDLIKEGFSKLVKQYKFKKQEFTFILSLIDNAPCKLILEALEDQESFTHVKTFINVNSNNKNHVFMSN